MSKKILITILLVLVILQLTPGIAEKYDQYIILSHPRNTEILSFKNGDTLYIESGGKAIYWERNEQNIAVITNKDYNCLNAADGIMQIDNGHYGLLMKDNAFDLDGMRTDRIEYWIWSEQTMELIRVWENGDFYSAYCDDGFLVYEKGKLTVLYNTYACELWRGDLCEEKEYRPYRLRMRSSDDWVCALNDHSVNGPYNACVRVINGNIAWNKRFEEYPSRVMSILPLKDGRTVIAISRNDGKYSPARIFILDQKGNIISIFEVRSEMELLTSISLLLESKEDMVFIYGSAVSNSKKTYLIWKLCFNINSDFYSWDIRNCDYHGDYSPGLRAGGNSGIDDIPVFVKLKALDDSQAPTVFIPFEELPVITGHYLTLSLAQ